MTCIHPVDQRRFLELWSLRLFSVRENQAESVYILNVSEHLVGGGGASEVEQLVHTIQLIGAH